MLDGKFATLGRWSDPQKEAVSKFMENTRLPSEVHRPMRHLNEVRNWKGTEYRSFLHYISVVVLKDCVNEQAYNHFLLYFCGVTCFASTAHQRHWPLAKKLLEKFVKEFGTIYGRYHLTSNVHNLQHVYGEVLKFGQLENFSAYCFENHLQFIKRCIKSGTKCVEQVAARVQARDSIQTAASYSAPNYPMLMVNRVGLYVTADFTLLPEFRDQWFLTHQGSVIKFLEAKKSSLSSFILIGIQIDHKTELFEGKWADGNSQIELSSADLFIYKIKENAPSRRVEVPCESIKCKLSAIYLPKRSLSRPPIDPPVTIALDTIALFPLLHTLR
ncbi:uncharacterized protein LOC131293861 [Anopheles ziemanni]|uniref:uncharacterized protein LOC131264628 n=1 Tax=Anopheles coustani TaxID=139045 RepID=UPI002658E5D7|nr:uncharacterized protein LOC131264628 [Anopheles coustani]XP_058177895.1 uncharacterized protein LOC131293861 [Anopheles ziemanni]